jgi:RHS repeat-associated protein
VLVAADALNHKTTRTYDANGNLKTLEDPDGNITEYSYDAGNRLTLVTRADSTELENEYWPDGSLKTQIDGANKATSYAHDPLGHLTSVTDPLLRATTFSFDAVGNVKSKASPGGSCGASPSGCTTYTYDAADELKTISYSDGTTPNVTGLTYDPNGRRTGMTDGTGTSSYVWDSLGRLKQSTDGAGKTVKYGYDLKGQVTSITYPSGADHVVTRTYDDAGRLATVTDWLDQETHFDFDANSNPDLVTYPNGTTAEYGVDAADRLMSIIDKKGTSTFASFGYTRTDANLLASGTFTGVTQPNETYGYSDLNQVTSVNTTGYDYDPADNLTQMGASTLAYDSANELTAKYGSITYVGGGANEDATGAAGQIVVTLSAAPQAGDQILIAADNKAGQNANMPAGYPVVGTFAGAGGAGEELRVFRRTADGTEGTSITVSFNQGTNVHAKAAAVVIYRGVDPSNPIDVLGTPGTTASGTSVTAPSVTAAQAGEQLVMFQSALNNTLGAGWTGQPAGMTKRVNSGPNIPMVALAIADKPLSAAGATGTQTATLSQSASLLGLLVALRRESTTYTYDLRGNRKTKTPPLGAATSYTYDQADRLKTIGSTSYTYNGDGLRMSKTVSGVTTPFAWNLAEGLPLLLSDNVNSYVYGPGGLPLEQIPFQTISYVGGGANHDATGTATTFAVSLSATPQANDQILVAVDNKAGQNASIGGTGWVTVGTYAGAGSAGEELRVFRKTATAIESNSVTVNFNQGTNVHAKAAAVVIYRGVDPTTPIDVIGTPGTTASGTSVTAPSVTTSGQVEQLVMFQSALNNTLGANWSGQPAGMTKRVNSGPNIPMVALAIADKPLNAAGATGAQTATLSQSASLLSLLIALKPPPPPVLYFHQDQLGSTRLLTDADGNIAATYTYDAYGTTTAKTGSSVTPLQYAGQYTDAETGFHFMRARYYDPITGQFLSRDPSGNSMQRPYAYASNSPVNAVDVNGLYPCAPPGFVGPAEDDCPIRFSDFTGFGNQEHGQVVVTLPSSSLDVTLTNVQFFDFMFNVGVAGKDSERFNLAPFTSRTVHLSPSGSYLTDDWCRIYVYDIKIESRLGPWAGFFLGGIIGSDASNVFDLPPFYGVGISWLATSPPPYNTIQGTFWEQG